MIRLEIERYRDITPEPHKGYLNWILENGTNFTQADFKEVNVPDFVEMKMCYSNSLKYSVLSDADYFQGFFIFKDIPILLEHAFNVVDGKVIDTTAQYNIGRRGKSHKPSEWFGIKLSNRLIHEYVADSDRLPDWVMPLQWYYTKYISKL